MDSNACCICPAGAGTDESRAVKERTQLLSTVLHQERRGSLFFIYGPSNKTAGVSTNNNICQLGNQKQEDNRMREVLTEWFRAFCLHRHITERGNNMLQCS